jgi:hypothetical protein
MSGGAGTAWRSHRELVSAIDEVLQVLGTRPPFSDDSVHVSRKAIKKARAALRLLREGLAEGVYRKENAALRDAGRYFSPLRDVKSLMDAFSAFRDRHPAELRQARYEGLATRLRAKRAELRRDLVREPAALGNCIRLLRECRDRIGRWNFDDPHPDIIRGGVRRIQRAGRKSLAGAKRERSPEASHEWRKQVKYLSNALKVLGVSGRDRLENAEARAARLADRLGVDHDLAELARYVAGEERVALDPGAKEILSTLIERRRSKLQERAFALGAKIYKEKPRRFAARLEKT